MSLSGWEGGRNCWHWIITLAERAVLASMSRGLSVPRTDYRAWFMTCRGVVTIARIHGMPSGVYACLRSQSDSWRYLGARFRIVVVSGGASVRFGVLSCLTRAKDRWILWRRIDARGCIELCVLVTAPFLGRYLFFLVWDSNWDRSVDLTEGCTMNCGDE